MPNTCASAGNPMATAANLLTRLKLSDPELALLCVPSGFVDCSRPLTDFAEAESAGGRALLMSARVSGRVKAVGRDNKPVKVNGASALSLDELQAAAFGVWKGIGRLQVELLDSAGGAAWLSVFQPLGWRATRSGSMLHFIGSIKRFGSDLWVSSDLEPPGDAIGGVWTRYLGIPGQVSAENVAAAVHSVRYRDAAYLKATREIVAAMQLDEAAVLDLVQYDQAELPEELPRLETLQELLRALHLPATVQTGERALQLAQRIGAASIRTAARAQSIRHPHRDAPLIVPDDEVLALAATQPETLSEDQRLAVLGIAKALRSPIPMNALLSGDVGTGKTLAFLLPAVVAHRNGAVVAVMAPTIILANQIAKQIAQRFGQSIRGVERVEAGRKIQNPDFILVGTSGLTGACAKARLVPHLVVLDEQHKLSVQTRSALVGPATHVLEATATPVPRSLATVFFEGVEVFSLRQSPVVRRIKSHVVDVTQRARVTRAIRETVAAGRRVLVVYPRLETVEIARKARPTSAGEQLELGSTVNHTAGTVDEEARSAQGVLAAAATFEAAFPGKVAVLHGMLSDDEKVRVIDEVRGRDKPLLVASVVVETGIDIPDIGLVVLRDADRLGLSQLHQLRGRLARNGGDADFFMMVESIEDLEDTALERLVACQLTTDGYRLAEIDMKQRGFGSYVDDSQTGSTQGVFRLTKISPADFLGIANATALGAASATAEEKLRDLQEARAADALMVAVRRATAELRAGRIAAPPPTPGAALPPPPRAVPLSGAPSRGPVMPREDAAAVLARGFPLRDAASKAPPSSAAPAAAVAGVAGLRLGFNLNRPNGPVRRDAPAAEAPVRISGGFTTPARTKQP